ncbi:SDR family oxidoreductase [Aquibacillus kalidii]|uniref:SDR family oxidoreductase n=1 Tax=Aquibacillus kalidii TaxID=2762597 RepID=UPI001F42F9BB|nr:SDR family oxidoreductase [Aquibacillus kalidii]
MRRWAVVTGASSGFGLLTTIELAKQGFDVLATMRSVEKASIYSTFIEKSEWLNRIHPFRVDVTNQNTIMELKKKIESIGRLDVLVNNAGFAIGGFAEEIEIADYRKQFETNVFGLMAVTQALLPIMRAQQQGKIINISSVSGRVAFPGLSPYVSSKHALEGYSESLRLELKPFGIQVALVEPGSYSTNIWSTGMEVAQKKDGETPYQFYLESIMSNLESGKEKHGDPRQVAKLIVNLATKKQWKKLRYPIGRNLRLLLLVKQVIPWSWWEKIVLSTIVGRKK